MCDHNSHNRTIGCKICLKNHNTIYLSGKCMMEICELCTYFNSFKN